MTLLLYSMLVLAIAVVMRGSIRLLENWEQASREVRWWPTDISDVFSAVPVITLSYLCHFNALSMHAELVVSQEFSVSSVNFAKPKTLPASYLRSEIIPRQDPLGIPCFTPPTPQHLNTRYP